MMYRERTPEYEVRIAIRRVQHSDPDNQRETVVRFVAKNSISALMATGETERDAYLAMMSALDTAGKIKREQVRRA